MDQISDREIIESNIWERNPTAISARGGTNGPTPEWDNIRDNLTYPSIKIIFYGNVDLGLRKVKKKKKKKKKKKNISNF